MSTEICRSLYSPDGHGGNPGGRITKTVSTKQRRWLQSLLCLNTAFTVFRRSRFVELVSTGICRSLYSPNGHGTIAVGLDSVSTDLMCFKRAPKREERSRLRFSAHRNFTEIFDNPTPPNAWRFIAGYKIA